MRIWILIVVFNQTVQNAPGYHYTLDECERAGWRWLNTLPDPRVGGFACESAMLIDIERSTFKRPQ